MSACVYCGKRPTEDEHAIHRDGFFIGPEVPLCNACGGGVSPSCEEIWERIAQPSPIEGAYRFDPSAPTTGAAS